MARKDALIDGWVNGFAESLGHTDGLTLLYGEARFTGRSGAGFEIDVGGPTLTAPEVFLNVGTRATKPPIPGLDDVAWLDNDSVLHLDQLPAHLVILGGSYIGLEIGQLFGRFGSAITVIERGSTIAAREDPEISEEIARFLTAEGHRDPHVDVSRGRRVDGRRRSGPRRRRRDDRRFAPAGGDRSNPEHGSPRPRSDRAGHRRTGLHRHRWRVPYRGRGRLGARRHQRPRRVHAHLVPGLRDPRRPPERRRPHGRRSHPDIRDVHRPTARAYRHERAARRGRQDAR